VTDDALYVNLFAAGTAELEVGKRQVRVEQSTKYPWDGHVEIAIQPETAGEEFALHVRIPGWARGQAWPSDLYSYLDASNERPTLAVNGEAIDFETVDGYAIVTRAWQPGDNVTLDLPMPVRRVVANEQVEADRGRVALMRGPLVFCVEGVDVAGGKVGDLMLPDDAPLTTEFRSDLLGGVQVITGDAEHASAKDLSTTSARVPFSAIPYYAWANRAKGEMAVWLARTADAAHED